MATVAAGQALASGRESEKKREEGQIDVAQLESWFNEQCDAHVENRREQLRDCDYYDHDQIDEATERALALRNQAPLVYNLVKPVVDWVIGTERRTRVDWKVHPRKPEGQEDAELKTGVLKFIEDANQLGFERSRAFSDCVKAGVGWIREYFQRDAEDGPPIMAGHVDWRCVRWDAYSRADDLRDCRSLTIERQVDLDYAIAMFPDQASNLREAALSVTDPGLMFIEDDIMLPQVFHGQALPFGRMTGRSNIDKRSRARVRLIETEYKRIVTTRRVKALASDYAELDGLSFDPSDGALNDLVQQQRIAIEDKPIQKIWIAIWHPGFLCAHLESPYSHNRFSLTPTWCYRRHRDGMPYGMIRGLRDPQDEYNKRKSKALFLLSTNRVHAEEDAIAKGIDEEEFLEEAAKPNGFLKYAKNALAEKRAFIEHNTDLGAAHVQLADAAARHIFEASGTTRENLGLDSDAKSGRAILAKQQQGAVATAEIFDNYRRSIQISGQKTLSLCEQYLTQPMTMRIMGPQGVQWLQANQPMFDPFTGQVTFQNDLTQQHADFVVDQQDYRETVRMAMAETLMDTIAQMPPDVGLQLLDLAIDLTDLPNRQEIADRIRKINGVQPQPADPAELERQQREQAQAEADAKAQRDALRAKTAKDFAAARKQEADAGRVQVQTRAEQLNAAGMLAAAVDLAPVADRMAPYPPAGQTPPGILDPVVPQEPQEPFA
jgi:hypothetical protein